MTVARDQRHLRQHRCPICDGADEDPRGKGKRCHGFTSANADYVHCAQANSPREDDQGLFVHFMRGDCDCGERHGDPTRLRAVDKSETRYEYPNEQGDTLYRVVRYVRPDGDKGFFQELPDGTKKLGGVRRVLYRLPELLDPDNAHRVVYVVEGEKDVDTLVRRGFLATTNAQGAGKWHTVAAHAQQVLRDRDVVVVTDADDVGRRHARQVSDSLRGITRELRVLEPPPPHKDVTDLLSAGGTLDQLVPIQSDTVPPSDKDAPAAEPIEASKPLIEVADADAIFAPLPPIEFSVEALRMAPGAPTAFAGPMFVAKTMFAQEIAIAKASGSRVLDIWHSKRGKVVHVDNEQGRRITFERYQRLARARGLTADDLRGYLEVALFPAVTLDAPGAYDAYMRLFDGAAIAILDSQKALTPSVDENASEARAPLDMLSSISDRTGCMVIVLDHTRKANPLNAGSPGDEMRGSNAKGQALQSLFMFSGDKSGPKRVDHQKERIYGETVEPFGFRVENVEGEGDARWGLRLVHMEIEQLKAGETASVNTKVDQHVETIREFFRREGPTFEGSKDALRGRIGISQTNFYAALSKMKGELETMAAKRGESSKQHWKGQVI